MKLRNGPKVNRIHNIWNICYLKHNCESNLFYIKPNLERIQRPIVQLIVLPKSCEIPLEWLPGEEHTL